MQSTHNLEMTSEQLDAVQEALRISSEYGLEVEVITWAMKASKRSPSISITEAVEQGLEEWIK